MVNETSIITAMGKGQTSSLAKERYLSTFGRLIVNSLNLSAFHSTVSQSLEDGVSTIRKEWEEAAKKGMESEQMKGCFDGRDEFHSEAFALEMSGAMADRSLRLAKQTLDAATLIFAHTLLDEIFSDCCQIAFLASPADWCRFVGDRRINISALQSGDTNTITRTAAWEVLLSGHNYLVNHPNAELDPWDEKMNYRIFLAVDPLMVLLFEADTGTLSGLSGAELRPWIPVLFAYYNRYNGSHDEAHRFIFGLVFRKEPEEFLAALKKFLTLHINHDHKRGLIWRLGGVWSPEVRNLFRNLLFDGSLKPPAAIDVVQLLCTYDPAGTRKLLEKLLNEISQADRCSMLVPTAGAVLLTFFPEDLSKRILEMLKHDAALGRAIAWSLLRVNPRSPDWISRLPAEINASLWHWLEKEFPGDPDDDGGGSVTPAHTMADFRRAVFQGLVQRSSREACEALLGLMRQRPQAFWLGDVLARMRKAARGAVWHRASPGALMSSFADVRRELIRTPGDLLRLLLQSLDRFQKSLQGSPPSMELWNEVGRKPKTIRDPKDKMNVSNCIKRRILLMVPRGPQLSQKSIELAV